MSQVASVILALVLVTPLVYLRLAGHSLDRHGYSQVALRLTVATTLVGLPVAVLARNAYGPEVAMGLLTLTAALCASAMLAYGTWVRLQLRRFVRVVQAVGEGKARPPDEHFAMQFVKRQKPKSERARTVFAVQTLFAVSAFVRASRYREAEELLDALSAEWLTPAQRALHVNALTVCRVHRGDVAGAKEALALAPERVEDAAQRLQLRLLDALCASLSGEPERALRILDAHPDAEGDPVLPRLVRAHALAATGDEDGAREALAALREQAGAEAFEAAAEIPGPATELARNM
jgi:hypothetical protein